jgi:hypothetical protein
VLCSATDTVSVYTLWQAIETNLLVAGHQLSNLCAVLCRAVCAPQTRGEEALQDHTIQPLAWEEVQGLAGPGVVGLPLGYTPAAAVLPPAAAPKALLGPAQDATAAAAAGGGGKKSGQDRSVSTQGLLQLRTHETGEPQLEACFGRSEPDAGAVVGLERTDLKPEEAEKQQGFLQGQAGDGVLSQRAWCWRRPGWTRAQYVQEAVAAARGQK